MTANIRIEAMPLRLMVLLLFAVHVAFAALPCGEIHRDLDVPCRCDVRPTILVEQGIGVLMDCDHVVFPSQLPQLPRLAPIIGYSQRYAGHQSLPSQMFGHQELPLQKLDFSHNSLRRLPDRLFTEVSDHLEELYLSDNLLADNLNPIFATSEFHNLANLKVLDLAGNLIRGIEEGIFKGCSNLQDLRLDRNLLPAVPSTSLRGPHTIRSLSLTSNRIYSIKQGAFSAQVGLERIRLDSNDLTAVEGGAFSGLSKLRELTLSRNNFVRLNSDVFQGIENLEKLDLSQNFFTEIPEEPLKVMPYLKQVNLSSNQIRSVGLSLNSFQYLESLDLSRNNIAGIHPNSFHNLRRLRRLDLSVNSLRTIETEAFDGLDNLEVLSLEDNNILLIPSSGLGQLPKLSVLNLAYNRISAISRDIVKSFASRLASLSLARNVIRELPIGALQDFANLKILDLGGNLLTRIDGETFQGLEESLESLNLADNKLTTLTGSPLQLSMLKLLDLSGNDLNEIPRAALAALPNLRYFNLSNNEQLELLPSALLQSTSMLLSLDISRCGLRNIHPELLSHSTNLKVLKLAGNRLQNISDVFRSLKNLTLLDLTDNSISNIRTGSFGPTNNLKVLLLDRNKLSAFKGEFFKIGKGELKNFTSLETISLSNNQLTYLFPSSFKVHPKLKSLTAHHNKFTYFPAELISNLKYLEKIDLRANDLKAIEDMDFSRLPRLRELLLSENEIEAVSESAFHNSTQLQILDLSKNKISRLPERTFEGLLRLEHLNLEDNLIADLPEDIFERSKLQILENINLAGNQFKIAPLKPLQRQYFFLSTANLSRNLIEDIPPEDVTMVNIKKLDLSFNPLTEESIKNILEEPKTVRELSLAGVGVKNISFLEMPFLKKLDLSHNNITQLTSRAFQRSTMLEQLNLADNKITSLSHVQVWKNLGSLQELNLSQNPIEEITAGQLDDLVSLKSMCIADLDNIMKIEKYAFKPMTQLKELKAYGFPRLGYLDVRGILQHLPTLELLDIEFKDGTVSSDELTNVMHPRLRYLGLRGKQVSSVSTGVFAGLKSQSITLKLVNTSVAVLPQGLFFPLPRSSDIALDISDSQISSLSPQFLAMFDDHRKNLDLSGLESNPILCDCTARALKKWLLPRPNIVAVCHDEVFEGQLLTEIPDEELSCDARRTTETTTTPRPSPTVTKISRRTTTESEIIWTVTPKKKTTPKPPRLITSANAAAMNNDDMLIISIVGGVVAFIVILVIVICIIRMRMVNTPYRGGPLAAPMAYPPSNACVYMAPSYATLPNKSVGTLDGGSTPKPYPTLRPQSQLHSYYQSAPPHSQSAYYIPYTPDEKIEYR